MHEKSLFAILLRSPWWISIVAGAGVFALTRALLPAAYTQFAFFAALPFIVIGGAAAWRQLRAPSPEQTVARLVELREMSWEAFAGALEAAWRMQGYAVSRSSVVGADIELSKAGRVSLVSCKRWKVARAGIEPLRELDAARHAREAHECIYVAAGDITDNARAFAAEKKIRLLHGAELASLLPRPKRSPKGPAGIGP